MSNPANNAGNITNSDLQNEIKGLHKAMNEMQKHLDHRITVEAKEVNTRLYRLEQRLSRVEDHFRPASLRLRQ